MEWTARMTKGPKSHDLETVARTSRSSTGEIKEELNGDWATCFPNWYGKQIMLLKNIMMPSDDRKTYTGMISSWVARMPGNRPGKTMMRGILATPPPRICRIPAIIKSSGSHKT